MAKGSHRRQRTAAETQKNLIVEILRNPRAQAALSGITFFLAFLISGIRWLVSLNGFEQLLVGIVTGFLSVTTLYFFQRFRTQSRFRRAVTSALMARLNLEDLRRLVPSHLVDHVSFTEFEKVGWLNKEIGEVWPFLGKATSGLIKEQLQVLLDDYKTGLIEALSIKSLWLGVRSPNFTGIKVLEGGDDDVSLEAIFDFQTDKEDVVIDVKTTGLDIALKVTDIHINGTLKLMFKPLREELPGFGAILISFLGDPDMGFNIRILGGDVKALPGVDNMIDSTIKTAITDVFVWPSRYVYPILPGDYSYLELRPTGVLDVSLIEATDLMNTDILGKSDPFALLFVRLKTERIKRSSTKKNTLHPVWNEGFIIEVDDQDSQYLTIRMMDEETIDNAECIGESKFPLKELKPHEPKELWMDLVYNPKTSAPQKSRGKVHLLVIYKPYEQDEKEERGSDEKSFKSSEDDHKQS